MRVLKTAVLSALSFACLASATTGKAFQYFMQIWLENQDYSSVVSLTQFQQLAQQGILLSNYKAISHPSQPNYIAAVGGSTFGITDDNVHNLPATDTSIFDLIEGAGLTWKAYNENIPSVGYTGASSGLYYRKHNPAISFTAISTNATRAAKVVPATQLASDISSNSVPAYTFYTPNINNDGHDTSATFAGNWADGFVSNTLNSAAFMQQALVLIVFDEAVADSTNHVWACLIGGAVPAALIGTTDNTLYTHYSAIHTVESNWGLPSLGRGDADPTLGNVFQGFGL